MGFIITFFNILLWLTPFLIISLVHLCSIIPSDSNDAPIAVLVFGALLHLSIMVIMGIIIPGSVPFKYTIQFIVSGILNLIIIIRMGIFIIGFNHYIEYFYEINLHRSINIHITFEQFKAISATNPDRWIAEEDKLIYITENLHRNYIGFKTYFDYLEYQGTLISKQREIQDAATIKAQTKIINSWLADIEADKAKAQTELQNAVNRINQSFKE